MASKGRSVWGMILTNFFNSIKPKKRVADLIGKDHFGNSYYEIAAEPSKGRRKAERYFETSGTQKFDQDIPVEWEAWLRGRRNQPPLPKEIEKNIQQLNLTLKKATELEARDKQNIASEPPVGDPKKKSYPKYDDYETEPGKPRS